MDNSTKEFYQEIIGLKDKLAPLALTLKERDQLETLEKQFLIKFNHHNASIGFREDCILSDSIKQCVFQNFEKFIAAN